MYNVIRMRLDPSEEEEEEKKEKGHSFEYIFVNIVWLETRTIYRALVGVSHCLLSLLVSI